jgi:uncharacterized protein YjhX (UPF0386 family)
MSIALEICALRSKQPVHAQSKPRINKSTYQGCHLEVMNIEKKTTLSKQSDPNIRTYGTFDMENRISSRKARSFVARGGQRVVKRLSAIGDLRCFRRSTASHKPSNVTIALYRELQQKKVALTFKIVRQFVKELKSNYPKTWFALNKYDHHFLHEISAKSPDLTMPAILSGPHRCTFGTDDGAVNSKFSSTFLVLMQTLETEIVASFKELAGKATEDAAEGQASRAMQ